ncbi:Etoposide induced 2.4 mRNA [Balamuthia mandrillaris]
MSGLKNLLSSGQNELPEVKWVDGPKCQHCSVAFSMWNRKHHCRLCGGVFCGSCAPFTSLPNRDSKTRACPPCKAKAKAKGNTSSLDTTALPPSAASLKERRKTIALDINRMRSGGGVGSGSGGGGGFAGMGVSTSLPPSSFDGSPPQELILNYGDEPKAKWLSKTPPTAAYSPFSTWSSQELEREKAKKQEKEEQKQPTKQEIEQKEGEEEHPKKDDDEKKKEEVKKDDLQTREDSNVTSDPIEQSSEKKEVIPGEDRTVSAAPTNEEKDTKDEAESTECTAKTETQPADEISSEISEKDGAKQHDKEIKDAEEMVEEHKEETQEGEASQEHTVGKIDEMQKDEESRNQIEQRPQEEEKTEEDEEKEQEAQIREEESTTIPPKLALPTESEQEELEEEQEDIAPPEPQVESHSPRVEQEIEEEHGSLTADEEDFSIEEILEGDETTTATTQTVRGNVQQAVAPQQTVPPVNKPALWKDLFVLYLGIAWVAFQELVYSLFSGLRDSLRLWNIKVSYQRSKTIKRLGTDCIFLNGVLLLGSYLLYTYLLQPHIHSMLHWRTYNNPGKIFVISVEYFLSACFWMLWLLPVYLLSIVLNAHWYERIANSSYCLYVYRRKYENKPHGKERFSEWRRKRKEKQDKKSFGALVGEALYRNLIFTAFFGLSFGCYLIPFVGAPVYFLSLCWLYSAYCFEYKWNYRAWGLTRKLKYFETRWLYFIGFGAPMTLISFFFDYITSYALISLLFPVFIPIAMYGMPTEQPSWYRVPMSYYLDSSILYPVINLLKAYFSSSPPTRRMIAAAAIPAHAIDRH